MIIGVWGDSITYGSCDSEGLGWVGRLRKSLPTNDNHQLYNFGVCGDTSTDVLERFAIEAKAIEPDIIVFAVGLNDTKYQDNSRTSLVSQEQYGVNLNELAVQAQKFTERIHFVGLTKIDELWRSAKGSRFINEVIEEYNKQIIQFAQKNHIPIVSVFEVLDPSIDLADGVHPNAQGYQKLFEVINQQLRLERI